ncbi:hypothetical protein [Desulfosporosinus sp. SB140]|uniref:hypothetical protein n=1 Tax=Desulfosporosinus paludis TaxID=3115649 RepID=UPI00388F950E
MPKITTICYLFSLLFYGMGYLKMLVLKDADWGTNDYTFYVTLATIYFVLTIFSAVIGSLCFYVKVIKSREITEVNCIEYKVKAGRGTNKRRRSSALEVKAQLLSECEVKLERRLSS